jgi:hypothetical protein
VSDFWKELLGVLEKERLLKNSEMRKQGSAVVDD